MTLYYALSTVAGGLVGSAIYHVAIKIYCDWRSKKFLRRDCPEDIF